MVSLDSNKLFLWNDTSLFLGNSFESEIHSHNAVQCCFALNGRLSIRWPDSPQWRACTTAVIGANVSHGIANPEGPICLLYLEKSSNHFQSVLDYHCLKEGCDIKSKPLIMDLAIPAQLIKNALKIQSSDVAISIVKDEANLLKEQCLRLVNGFIEKQSSIDSRISELLRYVNRYPDQLFNGAKLASRINLSESRMQHLFKQQMGIPIRRYLLWMRLRQVVQLATTGESLTQAAHSAGFSDSAHFSRTFKSMFGIVASSLFSSKIGLQAIFCE